MDTRSPQLATGRNRQRPLRLQHASSGVAWADSVLDLESPPAKCKHFPLGLAFLKRGGKGEAAVEVRMAVVMTMLTPQFFLDFGSQGPKGGSLGSAPPDLLTLPKP